VVLVYLGGGKEVDIARAVPGAGRSEGESLGHYWDWRPWHISKLGPHDHEASVRSGPGRELLPRRGWSYQLATGPLDALHTGPHQELSIR